MDNKPTEHGQGAVARFLDRAEVLAAVVAQLRKDLALSEDQLPQPQLGDGAFEALRGSVLPVLASLNRKGAHALQAAMYRVDIPEAHLRRTIASGGLDSLAGECVLRTLQKVLTRMRYAGRF